MRFIQALFSFLVIVLASTATFAQSRISGKSEVHINGKIAFPFVEKHFGALHWKAKEGGGYAGHFVIQRKYDFECDYSCLIEVDLPEDAFWFDRTDDAGAPSERDIYMAIGEATVIREGSFQPWGDCDFQAEFVANINLEVQDYVDQEWIDLLFVWAPDDQMVGDGKGEGPCFAPPAAVKVVP